MRPPPRVGSFALASLLLSALFACSQTPRDPVAEVLTELEAAAEARDADRFGARLSEGFRGQAGLDRIDALSTLRRYFAAYQTVSIDVYGVEVERSSSGALVRLRVDFAGEGRKLGPLAGLLPASAFYRFELQVADEGGTWRVTKAAWEAVPIPGEETSARTPWPSWAEPARSS